MKIEEGEQIFGKRWDEWTPEEKKEFVSCLEPNDVWVPACLSMAAKYYCSLSYRMRNHMEMLAGNTAYIKKNGP